MSSVSVRELRNHGGEVLDRVARGESLVVTRDGAEVAQIVPLPQKAKSTPELIAARRTLPRLELDRLRSDVDEILDPGV